MRFQGLRVIFLIISNSGERKIILFLLDNILEKCIKFINNAIFKYLIMTDYFLSLAVILL